MYLLSKDIRIFTPYTGTIYVFSSDAMETLEALEEFEALEAVETVLESSVESISIREACVFILTCLSLVLHLELVLAMLTEVKGIKDEVEVEVAEAEVEAEV